MAQRRFGPTRGAGVAVIEQEGTKSIEPAALGFAGYAGLFEKGPIGELIVVTNKKQFAKKMGGYIADGQAPDACIDYFDAANGAGGLCLVRVTDGNEAKAQATLYTRNKALLAPMGTLRAKNGGRWGGKFKKSSGAVTGGSDITNLTLTTGIVMKVDEWKGGYIELDAVANKRYPIVGNNAAGLITVAADQKMKDEWTASTPGTNYTYYLTLETEGKSISFVVSDGEQVPDTEFSLAIYVDGAFVKKYPDLNTNPTHKRYWVNIINNDDGNDEVEAVDLWTGAHDANTRPANVFGNIATVTATLLTATIHDFTINSPGGGNPTMTLGTTSDIQQAQKITVTMSSATAGTVVSDKLGALGSLTLGTLFSPPTAAGGANRNKLVPPFTVTAGASPLAASDTLVINFKPLVPSALIGGYVYPDKANAKRNKFRITANDHKSITAADGSDMTVDGATADGFMVEYLQDMTGGRDGHSLVVDATYNQKAWDTGNSPFNRINGRNLGLVKFATPGLTSQSVQQAGKAYAEAKNHQYRYEIPAATVTDEGALAFCNDTIGRSDYARVSFPSYAYVDDPLGGGEGKLKLVTMTGMIHGREARIAADFDGYHKAGAGVDAILPKVLKLTTGESILNEELLNPAGIGVIVKKKGNFVLWGDRTLCLDPQWKFAHQREQMSHYEHVLQENFDWIVFAINDPDTQQLALVALQTYFQKEYVKRALRGDKFDDAAIIKIDSENNTDATRADGDMFAELKLRLADTVERFIIKVSKQGIFDSVA